MMNNTESEHDKSVSRKVLQFEDVRERLDGFFLPNLLITRTFRENGVVTVKSLFAEQFVDGMSLELKYRATASHRELMIQSSGNENEIIP
ncbi:hypothetical protein CDAR_567671 [Caerostris darwini]|uniref:Uncharacterized protein n=1 Tax=Caerostris darwini TaxID=1538125 RepID=A0AAV4W9U2_9ARAC|nr:hypothetical protein CDAR_567671 [Caerostris darwini]